MALQTQYHIGDEGSYISEGTFTAVPIGSELSLECCGTIDRNYWFHRGGAAKELTFLPQIGNLIISNTSLSEIGTYFCFGNIGHEYFLNSIYVIVYRKKELFYKSIIFSVHKINRQFQH